MRHSDIVFWCVVGFWVSEVLRYTILASGALHKDFFLTYRGLSR